MAVGGSTRETKQFTERPKFIGFAKFKVAAINPDRDKLNKLLGEEEEKEIEYTGDKDGVDYVDLHFWLEADGVKHNDRQMYIPHKIRLWDEVRRNNEGDKIQLVNAVGDTAWVEADEDNKFSTDTLFDNFMYFTDVKEWELPDGTIVEKFKEGAKAKTVERLGEKEIRPALNGEEELLEFMKAWLSRIDLRKPDASLLLETKKLMSGNFRELTSLLNTSFDSFERQGDLAPVGFTGMAYVSVKEDDPDKQYQNIFKKFLPASYIKNINNGCNFANSWDKKKWNKFVEEIEGKPDNNYKYALKGFYVYEPLKIYNPDDDVATSKATRADVTEDNSKF